MEYISFTRNAKIMHKLVELWSAENKPYSYVAVEELRKYV